MDGVGWLCHMFYRADAIDNVIGQVRRLNYFVGLQRINRAGEQSSDNCLHGLCTRLHECDGVALSWL